MILSNSLAQSREADLQAFRKAVQTMKSEEVKTLQKQVDRDIETMKDLIVMGCLASSEEVGCNARLAVLEIQSEILQKAVWVSEKLKK